MQNGDFKDTTCTGCLRKEKTHINDIFGKVSRNLLIIGFCAGLLLSIVLFFILENYIIISTAIISIPTLVIIYETSLVKTFNNYRIRKK